jgi:hypothetical protein
MMMFKRTMAAAWIAHGDEFENAAYYLVQPYIQSSGNCHGIFNAS